MPASFCRVSSFSACVARESGNGSGSPSLPLLPLAYFLVPRSRESCFAWLNVFTRCRHSDLEWFCWERQIGISIASCQAFETPSSTSSSFFPLDLALLFLLPLRSSSCGSSCDPLQLFPSSIFFILIDVLVMTSHGIGFPPYYWFLQLLFFLPWFLSLPRYFYLLCLFPPNFFLQKHVRLHHLSARGNQTPPLLVPQIPRTV